MRKLEHWEDESNKRATWKQPPDLEAQLDPKIPQCTLVLCAGRFVGQDCSVQRVGLAVIMMQKDWLALHPAWLALIPFNCHGDRVRPDRGLWCQNEAEWVTGCYYVKSGNAWDVAHCPKNCGFVVPPNPNPKTPIHLCPNCCGFTPTMPQASQAGLWVSVAALRAFLPHFQGFLMFVKTVF